MNGSLTARISMAQKCCGRAISDLNKTANCFPITEDGPFGWSSRAILRIRFGCSRIARGLLASTSLTTDVRAPRLVQIVVADVGAAADAQHAQKERRKNHLQAEE